MLAGLAPPVAPCDSGGGGTRAEKAECGRLRPAFCTVKFLRWATSRLGGPVG